MSKYVGCQRNVVNKLCLIRQNITKLAIGASYLNTVGMEQKIGANFIKEKQYTILYYETIWT